MHFISDELEVDAVNDDVTVRLLGLHQNLPAKATLKAREQGVFAGSLIVKAFSSLSEETLKVTPKVADGESLVQGQEILTLEGKAGHCLSVERTLINYLSYLSGIATLTRKFVKAVEPHTTQILATRKTLPGLRFLQLQAVVAGGGRAHRRSLSDGILIKENHQIFCGPLEILKRSKKDRSPLHQVEIEVQSFELLDAVLTEPPEVIMLDNFSEQDLPLAVKKIRQHLKAQSCRIEVSGGMTLERVSKIAALGVDYISVGQLTHSSPSLNMSMDLEKL
jgi:nicotinate-nucleotide pyrophosphorylase (carboxylating)